MSTLLDAVVCRADVVAGGLVSKAGCGSMAVREGCDPLHSVKTVGFAKAMLREAAKVVLPTSGEPVKIRVGLHSGWVGG
jgi:class 3 adenylate cyclase